MPRALRVEYLEPSTTSWIVGTAGRTFSSMMWTQDLLKTVCDYVHLNPARAKVLSRATR